MTLAQLRDIAHAHGNHVAAFELDRHRRKTGKHQPRLREELTRLYWSQRALEEQKPSGADSLGA